MARTILVSFLLVFTFSFCTKEVKESERKNVKTEDEAAVRELIENYTTAYNTGDIETAVEFFDINYKGVVTDSSDLIGQDAVHQDLLQYKNQYPEGKWETKIDEITIADGYAFVLCSSSFLMPNPVEKKPSPIYSERSIRVLKKEKSEGWKFYRFLAAPAFTYD